MKFEDLNISEPILKAIKEKGYTGPTPIQEKAIPEILKRRDILGCAQTGTGKTAAFAVPIIQLIHKIEGQKPHKPTLRSLIITPTRELAIQIDENIRAYSKHVNIRHTVIFGGVKQGKQVETLKRGVHILVATPGRLLDLIQQGYISLSSVKLFVLDEADRMLDMGFINDIKKVIKLLPAERQSLFFSATMPDHIIALSKTIIKDPIKIEVTPLSSTAETIHQNLYYTNRDTKRDLLLHIIEEWYIDQALIFSRTKHGADRIARHLKKAKINAGAIHGDKSQPQRQKVLKQFKDKNLNFLVATDIAARGIDIKQLKYVINFDIPNEPESYVHRIGRSGRAGEEGYSISICEPEENDYIRSIEKLIGLKINIVGDHPFPQTEKPMTEKEKKEWNKEKQRRKQEFFANQKTSRNNSGRNNSDRNSSDRNNNKRNSPKQQPEEKRENSGSRDDRKQIKPSTQKSKVQRRSNKRK